MTQRRGHPGAKSRVNRRAWRWVVPTLVLALAGCGGDDDPATATAPPTTSGGGSGTTGTTGNTGSSGLNAVFNMAEVSVEAPGDWSVDEPVSYEIPGLGGIEGSVVSIDPTAWGTTWAIPGAFVAVRPELAEEAGVVGGGSEATFNLAEWHGNLRQPDCEPSGSSLFESFDGQLSGFTSFWSNCGGVGVTLIDVAAIPADGSFVVLGQATVTEEYHPDTLEAVLKSIVLL